MSLKSTAQEILVVDNSMVHDHADMAAPLEVVELSPEMSVSPHESQELSVHEPEELEIVVEELPGAPAGTKDPEPEPMLEVMDEQQEAADPESSKPKKNEKWDWESKGASGFVAWVKERISDVPKHSGYDSAGLERACAYLERLDNEISKAMRLDLDGELDANKIEEVRSSIDHGISRLQARLDKVKKTKKSNRKKKSDVEIEDTIVKEAQKITGTKGVFITADLLISGIARVCINGTVSAGHDLEDLYDRQVKEFGLNKREQAQVMWLLADMGFPLRRDRGFMPDQDVDTTSSDNMDWAANYKG